MWFECFAGLADSSSPEPSDYSVHGGMGVRKQAASQVHVTFVTRNSRVAMCEIPAKIHVEAAAPLTGPSVR